MAFLIGLIPTLTFALTCIIIPIAGGNARQQNFYLNFASGLISILFALFIPGLSWSGKALLVGGIAGLGWGFGQFFQLTAYRTYGMSRTMPLSTGVQLSINALSGLLIFGEWTGNLARICGISALILVITGAALCSWQEGNGQITSHQARKGIINTLICGSLFGLYPTVLRFFNIPANESIGALGVGILFYSFLSLIIVRNEKLPSAEATVSTVDFNDNHASTKISNTNFTKSNKSFINSSSLGLAGAGLSWAIGNLCMLFAIDQIGVATAFALSQLSVALSTLTGIFFLGEHRTKREIPVIIAGVFAIILGGILLSFTQP